MPDDSEQVDEDSTGLKSVITRRGALAGLAGLGLMSSIDTASAGSGDHLGEFWSGSPGSDTSGLEIRKKDAGAGLRTLVGNETNQNSDTGLKGETKSTAGTGVFGYARPTTGDTRGLVGRVDSPDGKGLEGQIRSSDPGDGVAVRGFSESQDGWGIESLVSGSGNTYGVRGKVTSPDGTGIFGYANSNTGSTRGLVGRVDSPDGTGLEGQVRSSDAGSGEALLGFSEAKDGTAVRGQSVGSGNTYGIKGEVSSSDGYGLYTPDDAKVDGTVEVLGDIEVSGVKNFVQTVSSDAGPKQVKYTSVEAGEPQTEHSDVVNMEHGVAVIELPDHFGMVTSSEERITVQVTPYCDEPVRPQVTDRSTDRIVVKDFGDGPDEYEFAYTVKGIRHGFEDQDVVTDL
jgi:hypothetical protein